MSTVAFFRTHDTESNFLRAFRGETLRASKLLDTGRRIVVVSAPRTPCDADDVAVIELPPARRWLARELTIVGSGYRLALVAGEKVQGNVDGRSTTRLLPLLTDRHDEPDAWVVVG